MPLRPVLLPGALLALGLPATGAPTSAETLPRSPATITLEVDPHITRSIAGESELVRTRYFCLSDPGGGFEERLGSRERYDYLVKELGISFGRNLGPVKSVVRHSNWVQEDPQRPGFVDLARLEKGFARRSKRPPGRLAENFSPNLDVAAHGAHHSFPDFMETWVSPYLREHGANGKEELTKQVPLNTLAAAELAAAVLAHGFDDLRRPRYFEPVNEPHWSYLKEPAQIAKWHTDVKTAVQARTPGVLVGGPCLSVAYLWSREYQSFTSVRNFIDATKGSLDFYSFHAYDYLNWENDRFTGTIAGGLPLEGTLDLVPNYTNNRFGKETAIVVSEHGGYAKADSGETGHTLAEAIARGRFPGTGFKWRMKARSIHEFIHLNSTIANTLTFMDHPHTVKKAVPFILLESWKWDPLYYASLLVKEDFDPGSEDSTYSTLLNFYKLFRDVSGHRVHSRCADPDIQLRAFANDRTLYVIAHNLAGKPETLDLPLPAPHSARLRRFGRNEDLTPFLKEGDLNSFSRLALGPHETLVVVANFREPLRSRQTLRESIHYGSQTTVSIAPGGQARFQVATPAPRTVRHATLRIGLNRPANLGKEIAVSLNGHSLKVPLESCSNRLTTAVHGYATTKLIPVDPSLLREENTVEVRFPDGKGGTIGSAVIRASRPES